LIINLPPDLPIWLIRYFGSLTNWTWNLKKKYIETLWALPINKIKKVSHRYCETYHFPIHSRCSLTECSSSFPRRPVNDKLNDKIVKLYSCFKPTLPPIMMHLHHHHSYFRLLFPNNLNSSIKTTEFHLFIYSFIHSSSCFFERSSLSFSSLLLVLEPLEFPLLITSPLLNFFYSNLGFVIKIWNLILKNTKETLVNVSLNIS
jgi:hypothetical protein